jgi:NAD(P)-dependent dehydrogenase (short-subunit alcohol dehydrogenase family)
VTATPLARRRVLITGATDGIGRHTALGLARLGADVAVVGRDRARGERAVSALRDELGAGEGGTVELLTADLSARVGVRRLADEVVDRYGRLDVLVNNVGGLYTERWETADGVEASLAVNALGPFLLTTLLRPALAAAEAARVVYVTGGMPGRLDLDDLQNTRGYLGIRAYSHAKTVLMALALEQARRWPTGTATVNVAYPGAANTPMTRAMTPATVPLGMRLVWPLFAPMMSRAEPARASRSSVRLAADPDLAGATGGYWSSRGRPTRWPRSVLDDDLRRRVWAAAHRLIALADDTAAA